MSPELVLDGAQHGCLELLHKQENGITHAGFLVQGQHIPITVHTCCAEKMCFNAEYELEFEAGKISKIGGQVDEEG